MHLKFTYPALIWLGLCTVAIPAPFGSITGHGELDSFVPAFQHREHEKITRAALGCNGQPSDGNCFEPNTLDLLAGYFDTDLPDIFSLVTLGAVGAPDLNEVFIPWAHCDDADYLDVPGYPQSQDDRTQALYMCISHFKDRFYSGITTAPSLLLSDNVIDDGQTDLSNGCSFTYASSLLPKDASVLEFILKTPEIIVNAAQVAACTGIDYIDSDFCAGPPSAGNAKCEVLKYFGAAVHGSQDFYAHSNWGDSAEGTNFDLQNPPGLGQTDIASFLQFRTPPLSPVPHSLYGDIVQGMPSEFTTECFTSPDQAVGVGECAGRVTHFTTNKDEGDICQDTDDTWKTNDSNKDEGVICQDTNGTWKTRRPDTPRGKLYDNFGRAVNLAIKETYRQWQSFKAELATQYGQEQADLMICAMTTDFPLLSCPFPTTEPEPQPEPLPSQLEPWVLHVDEPQSGDITYNKDAVSLDNLNPGLLMTDGSGALTVNTACISVSISSPPDIPQGYSLYFGYCPNEDLNCVAKDSCCLQLYGGDDCTGQTVSYCGETSIDLTFTASSWKVDSCLMLYKDV